MKAVKLVAWKVVSSDRLSVGRKEKCLVYRLELMMVVWKVDRKGVMSVVMLVSYLVGDLEYGKVLK
jgi:hypothetical protein